MRHDLFGPTSLGRTEACPAWWLVPGPQEDPDLPYAEEGTDLHSRIPPFASLDGLTSEQREAVEAMRSYIAKHVPPDQADYELQLDVAGLTFGTTDVAWMEDLIDGKFGWAPLFRRSVQLQMQAYAVGRLVQVPALTRVRVRVFQVRLGREYLGEYGRESLPALIAEIAGIIGRAQQASVDELRPGPEQCQYCPRIVNCPAVHRVAARAPSILSEEIKTPQDWMRVLDVVDVVEKFCATVRDLAQKAWDKDPFPTHKKVASTRRSAEDPLKLWEAVQDTLTSEEFMRCVTAYPGKVEAAYVDALRRLNPSMKKKAAEEAFRLATKDVFVESTSYSFRRVSHGPIAEIFAPPVGTGKEVRAVEAPGNDGAGEGPGGVGADPGANPGPATAGVPAG